MDVIAFSKTTLSYGWMSNMYRSPIVYCDFTWNSSEALFQALRFTDWDIIEKIQKQENPYAAKQVAFQHESYMTVVPCSDDDVNNMRFCLRQKLLNKSEFVSDLLCTGDLLIVEDCTRRGAIRNNAFWGAIYSDGNWKGKNVLGRLWMELRHNIKVNGLSTLDRELPSLKDNRNGMFLF